MDPNEWRVAQIKEALDKFLEVTYDPDTTPARRQDWAMFTLGAISGVVTMSDDMVANRIAAE